MRPARLLIAMLCLLAAGPACASASPPAVKHVFIVVLENRNYDESFAKDSKAPYLSKELPKLGQLLPNYYGVSHESLGNYVAMVSGQGANVDTQSDCQVYREFLPGTPSGDGQYLGSGCVYPAAVKTIADQLTEKGLTWRGYMEDMGNSQTEAKTCRHPEINAQDTTQSARDGDQYAARHNPFVYFHSLIDTAACPANDVPLDRLPDELRFASTTASYSMIVPNLCNDGHDEPCKFNGKPGGLASADAFLKEWVPKIMASPGYLDGGLLVVTFDEAEDLGGSADSSACCNQAQFPNTPNNGGPNFGSGGGKVGAVLLSRLIKPGTVNKKAYNHFSLLRTSEDIFGLKHLGYAESPNPGAFGDDVFGSTATTCTESKLPAPSGGRFPHGTLIRSLKLARGGAKPRLALVLNHGAKLSVVARQRGRSRRIGPRTAAACRSYRVALPAGHGRVTVTARSGKGSERRSVRF